MNTKEWCIFAGLIIGFGMMGTGAGGKGAISFAGLGLVIWVFWRGRKLINK